VSANDHHAAHPGKISPVLVLASASPRRRELLWQLGVPHRVAVAGVNEDTLAGESAADCVQRLALAKASKVWRALAPLGASGAAQLPVLGADTAVLIDGEMLGKPADRDAALHMLARLSGRTHEVLTAVALVGVQGSAQRLSRSTVSFRALAEAECAAYWESGEPCDKAGGYAIQGLGAAFVSELRGSYSGVVGLPLFETAALLDAVGVPRGQLGRPWRESGSDA
jgi:septum formation protein